MGVDAGVDAVKQPLVGPDGAGVSPSPPRHGALFLGDTALADPAHVVRLARCCGFAVLAVSLLSLAGWLSGRLLLASMGAGYIPMAPSTALCLALLALPLTGLLTTAPGGMRRAFFTAAPAMATLAGAALLIQFLSGAAQDMERWLLAETQAFGQVVTGRMSPLTASGILVTGLGLSLVGFRHHHAALGNVAGALGLAALLESLVVVLGYVYATPFLYGAAIIPMAFTTALGLGLLAMGLMLAAGTVSFPLCLFMGSTMQARLLRAFLPIPLAAIILQGLLFRVLPMTNPALHAALLALLTSTALIAMIYYVASTTGRRLESAIQQRHEAGRRLEEQLQRTQLLNDIARAIAERHDIESILRVVMAQLEEHLPIDFGGVLLLDDETGVLRVAARGPRSRDISRALGIEEGKTIDPDSDLIQKALQGHSVLIDDLRTIGDPLAGRYLDAGLHTVVLIPVMVESTVHGVLTALRTAPGAFTQNETRFLQQLTEQVAVAMQEARQYMALERAYDELRKTQDTMFQQERLRALGQMAGGIAHDINNALSPIVGYSDLLLASEDNLCEESRTFIENIRTAGYDIRAIIARLREFYREKEHSEVHLPVDLNLLARQVIELMKPRWKNAAQERQITIHMAEDLTDSPCLVLGEESEIREALMNLVINSLDALQADGTITLRTSNDEAGTLLQVADTGSGMDEETRRQCLEPFYTTKGDRGSGLGLGMVFGIITRHNGRIDIDSAPGRGTTIGLHFPPVHHEEPGTEEQYPTGLQEMAALRILYVDDEPHLRELVKRMLEVDRHHVTTADGGQAGIDAVRQAAQQGQPFDIVISDLGMPGLGGRQVARLVREEFPGLPIILLTGWGNRLNAEGNIPDNVNMVLSKPPKLEDLRGALYTLWNEPRNGG